MIKAAIIGGIIQFLFLWPFARVQPSAVASWLIDAKKFHISAHGQNSCQDCHEGITQRAYHPDPAHVNRSVQEFFRLDSCLSCHDQVMEDLQGGIHGTQRVGDQEQYQDCLRCHPPHEQPRLGENQLGEFDPGRPRHEQCGACHEPKEALPPPAVEDKPCVFCHLRLGPQDPGAVERIHPFCFHCHGLGETPAQKITSETVPLIHEGDYKDTAHAGTSCLVCHKDSAQFPHSEQKLAACGQCHPRHDEKVARAVHLEVSCGACHLDGVEPFRHPDSKGVFWARERELAAPSRIHQMIRAGAEGDCRRCHFQGNQVGAPSMLLPAKSILCMPCHPATFSAGDTPSMIALILFLAGLFITASVWLTGTVPGTGQTNPLTKGVTLLYRALRTLLSPKMGLILKGVFLDVFLQRRLYRVSRVRWLTHSLIFLPFVFRFSWGVVALIASLWKPEWSWVWVMLDKNHGLTALLFDVTGLMVLVGAGWAGVRGFLRRSSRLHGLPGPDYLALGLVGGTVVVGFFLEGLRLAMTGVPGETRYALLGYGISSLFRDVSDLTGVYGYVWYVHAILTCGFVAYLPFSRLFHVIMAPVVLVLQGLSERRHG